MINQRKESSSNGNNLNQIIDDRFVSQESDSMVFANPSLSGGEQKQKLNLYSVKAKGGPQSLI